MAVLVSKLREEPLALHFCIEASFLSTLDTKQFCLNPKQSWPLGVMSLVPSGMDRTRVNWVIQPLSSFFNEWECPRFGCQSPRPCPVFLGAGCWMVAIRFHTSPPATYRTYGPVVESVWGILLPQACECLESFVYISRATVCKLREQTDSKEFAGQTAAASSFGGLILCLDSCVAIPFLNFISLGRCFQVGFSVRNPLRRGVYMKWWVSKACLTQGTSETFS